MAESVLLREHGDLVDAATTVTAHLNEVLGRLMTGGDMWYEQHGRFGDRVWALARIMRGVLLLLDHDSSCSAEGWEGLSHPRRDEG
jgi:hypothetical protein